MNLKFSLWMAGKLVMGNKVRAIIPLLGTAVGLSLVFVILSIGEGGKRIVRSDLSLLGENRIMIGPGESRRAREFSITDAQAVERLPGVEYVYLPGNRAMAMSRSGNQMEMTGYSRRAMEVIEVDILRGRGFPLSKGEVLIDEEAAIGEYGRRDVTGGRIELSVGGRKQEYVIAGVYRNPMRSNRGGSILAGESEVGEMTGRVRSREMVVAFSSEGGMEHTWQMILTMLDRAHGGRNLYRVTETNGRYERIARVMRIINISLGVMGGAALLLGGAGAANMMLISIKERTGHIGIIRAVGGRGRSVGQIFLLETLMITIVGGILSIPGGVIASQVAGRVTGVMPVYGPGQGVVTLVLAIVMGACAGYYPAMKAARMEPIEAIRATNG